MRSSRPGLRRRYAKAVSPVTYKGYGWVGLTIKGRAVDCVGCAGHTSEYNVRTFLETTRHLDSRALRSYSLFVRRGLRLLCGRINLLGCGWWIFAHKD